MTHRGVRAAAAKSGKRACTGSCERAQLCQYSWVTHTTARLSARRFAAAGVAGAPVRHAGSVPRLPCVSSTLRRQAQRRGCAGGRPARARLPARFPVSPSALPDRLQSRELLPGAAPSLPATQRASPPPPSIRIISSQPSPALPPGCSQGSGRHSWTESDSSRTAGRSPAEDKDGGSPLRAVWTLRARRGKQGWEGSGRHRHTCTRTHTQRPTLLPREEIINLLGIKSAASQKPILPKRLRKASRPPPRALPASGPVAFVLRDGPDTRASVWAPRPHAGMKRGPGFAQTPRAPAPPAGLGAP